MNFLSKKKTRIYPTCIQAKAPRVVAAALVLPGKIIPGRRAIKAAAVAKTRDVVPCCKGIFLIKS